MGGQQHPGTLWHFMHRLHAMQCPSCGTLPGASQQCQVLSRMQAYLEWAAPAEGHPLIERQVPGQLPFLGVPMMACMALMACALMTCAHVRL